MSKLNLQWLSPRQITDDPSVQYRKNDDWRETAQEYSEEMKSGAKFPAIIVYYDGETYWLSDGFTRHLAASFAKKKLLCEIREGGRAEAKFNALASNDEHGQRLKRADKRRKVEAMLTDSEINIDPKTGVVWSDTAVANRCHVSPHTVARVREELPFDTMQLHSMDESERAFIHPKTGQPTTMKTGNIGRSSPASSDESPTELEEDDDLGPDPFADEEPAESLADIAAIEEDDEPQEDTDFDYDEPGSESEQAPEKEAGVPSEEPTLEEVIGALPLAQALALYGHGGHLFREQATLWHACQGAIKAAKAKQSNLRYTTGPVTDALNAVAKLPDPELWEGCAACKGSGRVGERKDPCQNCRGGFTIHKGEGVSADVVSAFARSL